MTRGRVRRLLAIALAAVFLYSATMYVVRIVDYKRGEELYDDAVERFVIMPPDIPTVETGDNEPEETDEPDGEPVQPAAPARPAIPPVTMDFDALAEINTDIVGWITIPDTKINYPLLYGETNDSYLRRAYNGQSSRMGSIFIDSSCSPDLSDRHTIIYGHNMRNSTMFSPLLRYAEQSFYDNHKYFYIYTPEGYAKYLIFSAHMETLPSDVYTVGFISDESFGPFVSGLTDRTVIASNVFPDGTARVVTLSTCSSTSNDSLRFNVHGYLVEDTRVSQ